MFCAINPFTRRVTICGALFVLCLLIAPAAQADQPTLPADGVLVGFTWDGTNGQSQIRFRVETDYDASRHHAANESEPEAEPDNPPAEAEAAQAPTVTAGDSGTNASTILIFALCLAASAVLATVLIYRKRRSRQ